MVYLIDKMAILRYIYRSSCTHRWGISLHFTLDTLEAPISTNILYRNWRAICGIADPHLRLFLSLTKDTELLRQVASGLPNVLVEERPVQGGPWPFSAIERVVEETIPEGADRWFDEILQEMGIPLVYFYAENCEDERDHPWVQIPLSVAEAIWRESDGGKRRYVAVKIEGEDCLFLHCFAGNENFDPPRHDSSTIWGYAIPLALIDMHA